MSLLSPAARDFLRARLGSLIQLDIALLLHADPSVWWSAERVAEHLRVTVDAARQVLEALASRNLLDVRIANDLTYRFAPWHESTAELIAEIAEHHYEARELIARGGGDRTATRFADAFRIRKTDG
ncbi:MAG TPA: hypothetical protein VGD94_19745 [Vicinamibacterales bacterium]